MAAFLLCFSREDSLKASRLPILFCFEQVLDHCLEVGESCQGMLQLGLLCEPACRGSVGCLVLPAPLTVVQVLPHSPAGLLARLHHTITTANGVVCRSTTQHERCS